jgi:predicted aconitase
MKLTKYGQDMLDGKYGAMRQKALQVLCDLEEYQGVDEFVEVTLFHTVYISVEY